LFLTHVKTMLVKAITTTFDETYPVEQYRGLHASISYPEKAANYPSIWVDFDVTKMEPAGVDTISFNPVSTGFQPYKIWKFEGRCSFTIVALTSLERDGIYDEMVKIIAFGSLNSNRSVFRTTVDSNEYIATKFNWDRIQTNGMSTSMGTPWGTQEILYEVTISMEAIGEFSSDLETGVLLPLSAITVTPAVGQ